MKTIVTLALILLTAGSTLAQNPNTNVKVDLIEMGIVMVDSLDSIEHKKDVTISNENKVARLYRYKNSRVTKELFFITKKDKPKMA